jgi:hypothetical protein
LTIIDSILVTHCRRIPPAWLLLPSLLLLAVSVSAQSTAPNSTQFWFEYDPTFQLSRNSAFDTEAAFHFARDIPEPWRELSVTPNIEYTICKWIDVTGGVSFTRTRQTDSFGSLETKPYVGARFKSNTPWRGIRLVNFAQWEFRFQHNLDTDETQSNRRFRNRIQLLIPVNTRNLSEDRTFYLIIDGEAFGTPGQDDVEGTFQEPGAVPGRDRLAERRDLDVSVPLRSSEVAEHYWRAVLAEGRHLPIPPYSYD